MNNFKFIDLYKNNPITFIIILSFISIISALFMPAMFTFTYGLPLLIILVYAYVSWRKNSILLFSTLIIISGLSVVILIGFMIYMIFFTIFINSFPTFVVLLIAFLLTHLIPKKTTLFYKILFFIFISTLLGLNTKIIDLMKQKYIIEEKVNEQLVLSDKDIIKIIGDSINFPSSYNTYDFITFGANEGCGCGYWEYPNIRIENIKNLLQQREISYTHKNDSPYTLSINSSQNKNVYTVEIQLKSNSKLISSLKISDYLPYQSTSKNKELDDFAPRLEYLLRHNVWNELLFLYNTYLNKDNTKIINEFLNKSIKSPLKNTNWNATTLDLNSTLLYESEKLECTSSSEDDYKDYPFSVWYTTNQYSGVKVVPETNYIFDSNNTIYTTKDHSTLRNAWINNSFAYLMENHVYIFFTFTSQEEYIRVFKFTKNGQFVSALNIHLPSNKLLEGRDWHPISHVEFINNKIQFRFYNIYEFKGDSLISAPIKNNECSFYMLEIEPLLATAAEENKNRNKLFFH